MPNTAPPVASATSTRPPRLTCRILYMIIPFRRVALLEGRDRKRLDVRVANRSTPVERRKVDAVDRDRRVRGSILDDAADRHRVAVVDPDLAVRPRLDASRGAVDVAAQVAAVTAVV